MSDYRSRKNKKYWWLVAFTVVVIGFLFFAGSFVRGVFSGPLIFFTQPLWQASDNLGTLASNQISTLGQGRQVLLAQLKGLQEENRKLKILLLAKNNVESDNVKLRAILGRQSDKAKPLLARVVFLPNFIPYNNLLLDIGRSNATRPIKIGDLVIADGAVLIGRLIEIDTTFSKARLISAENNLPVIIGAKNIPAIAMGSGAGNFTITLPKDTPVAVGDKVTAPLLNNYFIGQVGHIEKLISRPTQTILVRTPVNLFQLRWLEIYDAKI